MFKRKTVALLTAVSVMMLTSLPVIASEYAADGDATCAVSAIVGSTYSVTVPAAAVLENTSGATYEGDYEVSARGNITNNQKINIVPEASFVMTGTTTGATATANVTQEVQHFVNSAVKTSTYAEDSSYIALNANHATPVVTTGSITVELTQADSYNGNLKFTFNVE